MENSKVELHVFVDASTKVFAATVYARILNRLEVDGFNENNVNARGENHDQGHQGQVVAATLITAKARVIPTKTESVSHLELAACMIGTKLGLTVANTMDIHKSTITFWSDSTNCRNWINSPSSALKTFVANRVGEVHMHSKPCQWRHIPTDLNPDSRFSRK
jgi:Pao retrotransposon peptidase